MFSILLLTAIVIAVYFLPTIFAIRRRHRNGTAILALNLLLGWTILGWVAALVWSLTNDPQPSQAMIQRRS